MNYATRGLAKISLFVTDIYKSRNQPILARKGTHQKQMLSRIVTFVRPGTPITWMTQIINELRENQFNALKGTEGNMTEQRGL